MLIWLPIIIPKVIGFDGYIRPIWIIIDRGIFIIFLGGISFFPFLKELYSERSFALMWTVI